MKILSWDVGIIHLAYCIIDIQDNRNKILDWGNLNLLKEPDKTFSYYLNLLKCKFSFAYFYIFSKIKM